MREQLLKTGRFWKKLLFILLIIPSVFVFSQPVKIDTDRPDQTESAFTVPKHWLQQEMGFVKTKQNSGTPTLNIWTLPVLLTRIGLTDRFELRLINEYERWGNEKRLFKDTLGFLPLQIGTKINLVKARGIIPQISLIAHAGLRRLASRLASNGTFFAPNFRFTLQNSVTEKIAIGYNLGAEWENTDRSPYWIYTFAPGMDVTERLYAYIELFGSIRKGESPQHSFDGGIAYYITSNLKSDASAGFRITPAAPAYYVSLGLSWRFPLRKKLIR